MLQLHRCCDCFCFLVKDVRRLTLLCDLQTYVSMGQWYMGRSEEFFDKAGEFRPERWLGTQSEKTESSGQPRVDEILRPFSLGPRNCLGKLYVSSSCPF